MRRILTSVMSGILSLSTSAFVAGAAHAEDPAKPVSASWKGAIIKSEDGKTSLRVGYHVQADLSFFPGDKGNKISDGFSLRRVRPIIQGTLFGRVDYKIMADFAGGALQLLDAYGELKLWPELRIRLGKTKPPLGLERLQSATANIFVERAFPTLLVPNRDVGAYAVGDIANGLLHYELGAFDGVVDGGSVDTNLDDNFDLVGRLLFKPFVNSDLAALKGLAIGGAVSYGSATGKQAAPQVAKYATQSGKQTFYSYAAGADAATTVVADGTRLRGVGQLYWAYDRVGVLGEFVRSQQALTLDKTSGTAGVTAWQGAVSVLLTDDNASFDGVKPHAPLDPEAGHWGAVELAARVSGIHFDSESFDKGFADKTKSVAGALSIGADVNWYLDATAKLQLGFEHITFDGGAGTADRKPENALVVRLQLAP